MSCVECTYLSSVESVDFGRIDCCNAYLLEDGNGHPMMSRYATHDWCPMLNGDERNEVK